MLNEIDKSINDDLIDHVIFFNAISTRDKKTLKYLPLLDGNIDFINISRHAIGYENNVKIFKTKFYIVRNLVKTIGINKIIITWVKYAEKYLHKDGIPSIMETHF
jgi:hypothetical protein